MPTAQSTTKPRRTKAQTLSPMPAITARRGGHSAREHILSVALQLFAEQGFANTTTRQISAAAGVNIAQISYHFGDKAGLYRTAFMEPMGSAKDDIVLFNGKHLSLREALTGLYTGFIEPLKNGELARQCVRLQMREMIEPTGLWSEEVDGGIKPHHAALVKVLARHLGLKAIDDEVHRLAMAIVAQGVFLYVGRDVMEQVTPQLMNSNDALNEMRDRLVMYALALVKAEAQRRKKAY